MATSVQDVIKDPNFLGLPREEQRKVMVKIDQNFSGLPSPEQDKVLDHFSAPKQTFAPPPGTPPTTTAAKPAPMQESPLAGGAVQDVANAGKQIGQAAVTAGQQIGQAAIGSGKAVTDAALAPVKAMGSAMRAAGMPSSGSPADQVNTSLPNAAQKVGYGAGMVGQALIPGGEPAAKVAKSVASKFTVAPELEATAAQTTNTLNRAVTPKISAALHSALDTTAADAGVALTPQPTASAKAVELAQAIKGQGSAMYKQLDAVTGGRYQQFRDTIDGLEETIRNTNRVNPEAAAKAREQLQTAMTDYKQLQDELIQQGVNPATIKAADAKWTQGQALMDFAKKVKNAESLSGELKPGAASIDNGLKALTDRRLDSALGKNAAGVRSAVIDAGDAIVRGKDAATAAQKQIETIKGRQKVAKWAATAVGTPSLAVGGYEALKGK